MRHHAHLLISIIIIQTLLAVFISPAVAQTDDPETTPVETTGPIISDDIPLLDPETPESTQLGPTTADYFRVLIGLVVVIVVIWGLSVLLKRFVTVRGLTVTSESLKVLYTLSLTPTRTLYLVRLADRILLIGSGDGGGLRTLADITDPEEVSAILKDVEHKGNFEMNPFRTRLKTLITGEIDDEALEIEKDLGARHKKIQGMMDRLKNTEED